MVSDKNAAFEVHVEERGREEDLLELFRAKKSQLQDKDLDPLELLEAVLKRT